MNNPGNREEGKKWDEMMGRKASAPWALCCRPPSLPTLPGSDLGWLGPGLAQWGPSVPAAPPGSRVTPPSPSRQVEQMERFASPWEALFPVLDSKGISAPNFRHLSSPQGSLVPTVPPPAPPASWPFLPGPRCHQNGWGSLHHPRPRQAAGAASPEETEIALWDFSPLQEPPGRGMWGCTLRLPPTRLAACQWG